MEKIHDIAPEPEAQVEQPLPLAFPFTRGGYRHVLLARTGRVCLVERTSTHPESRGSVHYEVVVLRHLAVRLGPRGQLLPACEAYPSSTAWGRAGWTYTTRGAAACRYGALCLQTPSAQEPRAAAGPMHSLSAGEAASPAAEG